MPSRLLAGLAPVLAGALVLLPRASVAQGGPPPCVAAFLPAYVSQTGGCRVGETILRFSNPFASNATWQSFFIEPLSVVRPDGSRTYGFRLNFGPTGLLATSAEALSSLLACPGAPTTLCANRLEYFSLGASAQFSAAEYVYTPPAIRFRYGTIVEQVVATEPQWEDFTFTQIRTNGSYRATIIEDGVLDTYCIGHVGQLPGDECGGFTGLGTIDFQVQAGINRSPTAGGIARAGISSVEFVYDLAPLTAPEPGTWALVGTGLLALAGVQCRRSRR